MLRGRPSLASLFPAPICPAAIPRGAPWPSSRGNRQVSHPDQVVSSTQLPGNYDYEVTNLKTDVDRLKVQIINLQSNVSDICKISLWGQRLETLERIKEALRCREY